MIWHFATTFEGILSSYSIIHELTLCTSLKLRLMTRSLRHNNLLQMKRHPSLRVVYDLRARAWKTDKVKLNDLIISYSVWIYTFLLIRSSKRRAHHSSRSESWIGATKSFNGIWPQRRQNEVESGRKRKESSQRSETKYLRTGLELHPKMRGGDEAIPICIFSVKLGKDTFMMSQHI